MIHTHRWMPPAGKTVTDRVVYILHGVGEHAGRYAPLASRLAESGYIVGAHDHPGHGLSDGKRGLIDPPGALVTQAAIQIQSFRVETGLPVVVLAHSMGGAIAAELVLQHELAVAGLILSAPAFAPRLTLFQKLLLRVLVRLAPNLCIEFPYSAALLTTDPEQQRRAEADPLNHGFKSAGMIDWLSKSGERSMAFADRLNVQSLMLIAGDDKVVSNESIRQFAEQSSADKITLHEFAGGYHELLNERPELRDQVMQNIDSWLARFP
ncbi:MAG: lysophospholipase [Granulosicoccus sp.]